MDLIFLHGLEGSSQGVKATLLRERFAGILTPDFRGSLDERMGALLDLLEEKMGWTMIGSSFGGLMAALFACQHPGQVEKMILFAPALIWPDFAANPPDPIEVPTIIYHGTQDKIVPIEPTRQLAETVFSNLDFRAVDDDHGLYHTVHEIDWGELVL